MIRPNDNTDDKGRARWRGLLLSRKNFPEQRVAKVENESPTLSCAARVHAAPRCARQRRGQEPLSTLSWIDCQPGSWADTRRPDGTAGGSVYPEAAYRTWFRIPFRTAGRAFNHDRRALQRRQPWSASRCVAVYRRLRDRTADPRRRSFPCRSVFFQVHARRTQMSSAPRIVILRIGSICNGSIRCSGD